MTEDKQIVSVTDQQPPEEKVNESAIFCIGDSPKILQYDYRGQRWSSLTFSQDSKYMGSFKFASICQLSPKKKEFVMTGGCHAQTQVAQNSCFRFSLANIRTF